MTKSLSIVCALVTTFIWGTAFIAQDTGMDNIGPLTFNAARFLVGFVAILPFAFLSRVLFEVAAPARVPDGPDAEREAAERAGAIEGRVRERSAGVDVAVVWEIALGETERDGGFDSGELAALALGSEEGDERAAVCISYCFTASR